MLEADVGFAGEFRADGTLRVRALLLADGRRLPVGQGRQWADADGRHVLLQLPDGTRVRLTLRAADLTCRLSPLGSPGVV